jgi:hypothetical protein
VIVFAPSITGELYQVSVAGGLPTQITTDDGKSISARLPQFLPDGRHLLFVSLRGDASNHLQGTSALDLDTKKITAVAQEKSEMVFVDPGYVIFVRDKNLLAQRFDVSNLRLTGEAVTLAEGVAFNPIRFKGSFSASNTGLLIFLPSFAQPTIQLTWYDLDGKKLEKMGQPAQSSEAALSPDGKRLLLTLK